MKPKKKYQCILFDCDGTLVDSETTYSKLLAEKIRYFGYKMSDKKCSTLFRGVNYDYIKPWLMNNFKDFPIKEFEHKLFTLNNEHSISKNLIEIKGAKNLLSGLDDYPKCIVTNGALRIIKRSLDVTDLREFFSDDEIFTYELVSRSKPAPDVYNLACEKMRVDPKKSIALEDSIAGATASIAANINTVAIIAHKQDMLLKEQMLDLGVIKVIYELEDFKELLYCE